MKKKKKVKKKVRLGHVNGLGIMSVKLLIFGV